MGTGDFEINLADDDEEEGGIVGGNEYSPIPINTSNEVRYSSPTFNKEGAP